MPPEYGVRFRLTFREIDTFHRREWRSAQRIRITMIAGGNHSIISMNASPTVFFRRFQNSPTNTNLSGCYSEKSPVPFGTGDRLHLENIAQDNAVLLGFGTDGVVD